jgi:hypothetical protein
MMSKDIILGTWRNQPPHAVYQKWSVQKSCVPEPFYAKGGRVYEVAQGREYLASPYVLYVSCLSKQLRYQPAHIEVCWLRAGVWRSAWQPYSSITADSLGLAKAFAHSPLDQYRLPRYLRAMAEANAGVIPVFDPEENTITNDQVYFLRVGEGPIKIGTSANIPQRYRSIQANCPFSLRVVALMGGGRDVEAQMHRRFAQFRMHGEWFMPEPELLAHVEALNGGPASASDYGIN